MKRLTNENERLTRELRDVRHALEKAQLELKTQGIKQAQKPAAPQVSKEDEPSYSERFTVIRENLQGLAEARKTLVNSDQMSDVVLNTLDQEITQHITCLTELRQTAFPIAATKAAAPTPVVPGQVPFPPRMPAMPSGFSSAVR
jgi:hypothetical protein